MDLATGKLTKLHEIKGMMLYKVTSLAFDPDARTAYYTEDNYAFRDLIAVNVDTGKQAHAAQATRASATSSFNPADKSIWGIRHQNGLATLVRIPPPYAGFNQVHTFKYGEIPFDLDISPDGELLSASFGEVNGKQSVRVWKIAEPAIRRRSRRGRRLALPPSTPGGLRLRARRQVDVRHVLLHRRLEHLPLRHRHPEMDAVSNASTGFFRPIPQADGIADRLRI